MRRFGITLVAMAILGVPVPGHAASHTITDDQCQSAPCSWVPGFTHAEVGDTITWDLHGGVHNVTQYAGDGSGFSSPSGASTYSNVFSGGQWWFRCRLHSRMDGTVCVGMCGTVTNRTTAPTAPTITSPNDGAAVPADVTVAGTAQPWMLVTVYRSASVYWRAMSGANGDWSVPVTLSPGTITLTARAYDAENRESPGVSVTLTVGSGDTAPPSVTIQTPTNREILLGRPPNVGGVASDDTGVVWVQLWIQRFDCPTFDCGSTIKKYTTCAGCAAQSRNVTWSVRALDSPGYYVVAALARDLAGHETLSERVYFMVVDNGILPATCPSAPAVCTMPF